MAPVPVVVLMFVILFVIGPIILMAFGQVTPVGVVFTVIPVVVVMVT